MVANNMQKPKTVIIPIAGKGTRMFPATAGVNKAFLPIGKTNLILETLREARLAGIEKFVLVTNPKIVDGKKMNEPDPEIVDFFKNMQNLVNNPEPKYANDPIIQDIKEWLPTMSELEFVPQLVPEGLGHAVYQGVQHVEKGSPFAVILPDDYIASGNKDTALTQMSHDYKGGNMIAAMQVSDEDIKKFGAFDTKENGQGGKSFACHGMVEKSDNPPSNLAAIGRYILDYSVLDSLHTAIEKDERGKGNEIQITDAIVASQQELTAYKYDGKRCDCGNELGYMDAQIDIMLRRGMKDRVLAAVKEYDEELANDKNKFANKIMTDQFRSRISDIGAAEHGVYR